MENTYIVTLEWLNTYRTPKGGFTKAQTSAFGLDYNNLFKGWLQSLVGIEITKKQKDDFEKGRLIKAKKNVYLY